MFAKVPSRKAIEGLQVIVVASAARSSTVREAESIRPFFTVLRDLEPQHVFFKVCSTFDSSPERGNIARVIKIGAEVFDQAAVSGYAYLGTVCDVWESVCRWWYRVWG